MKKRKDYLKCGGVLVSLVMFIIIISGITFAQEERLTDVVEYDVGVTSTSEFEPAPQGVIDKINDYIISMVGTNYFKEHLQLKKNYTKPNIGKFGERYILTYKYTHNLKDKPESIPHQVEYIFELRVDSEGELVGKNVKYKGPKKPYQFLISKNESISKAIEYGLKEPFEEPYVYYGNQGYSFDTPIEDGTYGWFVWSKKCIKGKNVRGLFVDVDTGIIISTKTIETTCEGGETASLEEEIIESNQGIQINDINTEKMSDKSDSDKERINIIQRIIGWIKILFTK